MKGQKAAKIKILQGLMSLDNLKMLLDPFVEEGMVE
jgi:hypothetical protein